jgi:hypothetical protein
MTAGTQSVRLEWPDNWGTSVGETRLRSDETATFPPRPRLHPIEPFGRRFACGRLLWTLLYRL